MTWSLYSDPRVASWTGPWSRESVEVWTRGMATRRKEGGVGKLMAHNREDGSLVGRGGFTRFALDGEAVLELGWAVRDTRGVETEKRELATSTKVGASCTSAHLFLALRRHP